MRIREKVQEEKGQKERGLQTKIGRTGGKEKEKLTSGENRMTLIVFEEILNGLKL
jgi:hypothetical protein